MKKILLIFAVLLFSHIVYSQDFKGGAMFGIVGSEVDGDSLGGLNKVGLFAGAFTSIDLSKKVSIQVEISYIQKGSQKNPDIEEDDYESYKLRANYFEIPVLFQFKAVKWLQFEAGPSIAFLASGKEYINEIEITPFADFKPVTYNFIVGANAEFIRNFFFSLRFDTSLDPIRKGNFSGNVKRFPTFEYGQYHNCLVISLKYRFLNFGS